VTGRLPGCRDCGYGSVPGTRAATTGRATRKENYREVLLLKRYRGAPASVNDAPMDQWTPEEVDAHVQYMRDFAVGRLAVKQSLGGLVGRVAATAGQRE